MSVSGYQLIQDEYTTHIVIGHGLIGSAITTRLRKLGSTIGIKDQPNILWDNATSISNAIKTLMDISLNNKLSLIWCAGKAGFLSSDQDLEKEFNVFRDVIQYLSSIYSNFSINYMSSAGGIYENTPRVTDMEQDISANRPYANWKLRYEKLIQDSTNNYKIYRISSVYGTNTGNTRMGMIAALINSAYTNSTALIYAKPSTLRDYISNEDLAKYIVSYLSQANSSIKILASGKPTSIDMLINTVSRATKRKPKVTYIPKTTNDKNIVFARNCLPPDLSTCSLEEGVQKISSLYSTHN